MKRHEIAFMHVHPHPHSSVRSSRTDRAGSFDEAATPSGGVDRRWAQRLKATALKATALRPTALKPLTYSLMHLLVAISVAYALTRDWRIALGVGVVEPMVQTLAYMLHGKAWSLTGRRS